MRKIILLTMCFLMFYSVLYGAQLSNEVVKQDGRNVVFSFDIESTEEYVDVKVVLSVGNKRYTSKNLKLSGDAGKVKPGKGKRITWNVIGNFPEGYSGEIKWELSADDIKAGVDNMVEVKGGCFQMGDMFGNSYSDDDPAHEVCLSDFYIRANEVTVGEFRKFVKNTGYKTQAEKGGGCFFLSGDGWESRRNRNWRDPGFELNDSQPVVCVSMKDSKAFLKWLSKESKRKYRLPTEAEWEYAARSKGKKEKWSGTSSKGEMSKYAWFIENSKRKANRVGKKLPNSLGIYDMTGNVWEWVSDKYDSSYYEKSPAQDPSGPSGGSLNVLRGGSWFDSPDEMEVARRLKSVPEFSSTNFGFRYVTSK
ncbi:MAG: formylglycine-generating enzyme family protein [Nitrospirota bacterium]|nr:MAG: formylglycine-generating enzyme family protein [Nitrospirota bacterium]